MIKLENVVLASPEQMEFIIEGMRNPMNSWDRSDSYIDAPNKNCNGQYSELITGLPIESDDTDED